MASPGRGIGLLGRELAQTFVLGIFNGKTRGMNNSMRVFPCNCRCAEVYIRPDMSPENGSCAQLPMWMLLNRGGDGKAHGCEERVKTVEK